jgi:hypothetical protein
MVTGCKDHLSADAMKAGKCGTYDALDKNVRNKGELWSKSADGTMAEVCAKLGIPVEEP